MFEIGPDEIQILEKLIHVEKAGTIIEESNLSTKVAIDIIRQLFHYRYIKSLNRNMQTQTSFDVDGIKNTYFQITAKGFQELNENKPTK